jgi:hypothetical protein
MHQDVFELHDVILYRPIYSHQWLGPPQGETVIDGPLKDLFVFSMLAPFIAPKSSICSARRSSRAAEAAPLIRHSRFWCEAAVGSL